MENGHRKKLGLWGEELATSYLADRGYKIVAKNYSWKGGEVDIIAEIGGVIVFVEVKTSDGLKGEEFSPESRIDSKKERKIIKTANLFLDYHFPEIDREWQVDIVSIVLIREQKKALIRHFKNVSLAESE